MKIGIIADVHANFRALEAVLAEMGPVEMLCCAGDITGYYHDINEVIEVLRDAGCVMILGNHDYYLVGNMVRHPNPLVARSLQYTRRNISAENLALLGRLPVTRSLSVDGLTIRMFHGSPWNPLEHYLYPDSDDLDRLAEVEADVIILGHTHYPFGKEIGGKLVINPGSVGQGRPAGRLPSYAILQTGSRQAELHYVDSAAVVLTGTDGQDGAVI